VKKKLLSVLWVFLLAFSSNILYSQISKSIVDTTKQWNILETYQNTQEFKKFTHLYRVSSEDTIINNKTYLRLEKKANYDTNANDNWEKHNWIREDSNKVYIFTYSNTVSNSIQYSYPREYLLFDFNLGLNDTFHITCEENEAYSDPLGVSFIDSIEIENQYYRRILFNEGYPQYSLLGTYWIEGIGSNGDFINHYNHLHSHWDLMCVYRNNNLIFDGGFGYCYIQQGLDGHEPEECSLKIYPTIVNDILNIDTELRIYKIIIHDIYGRSVLEENLNNTKTINCKGFKSGIYDCLLITKDNILISRKFIKN